MRRLSREDFPTEGKPINATCESPVFLTPKPDPPPFLEVAILTNSFLSFAI